MGSTTSSSSSPLLKPASKISTNFQCTNCHTTIDQVSWQQCHRCNSFDLCEECADIGYDKLPSFILNDHKQYHREISLTDPVNADIQSILIKDADAFADRDRNQRTRREFERILNQKEIQSDYEMSIVMDMFKANPTFEDGPSSQLDSMIVKYHTQAYQRDIRVLSLDGGGIRGYMPIKVLSQLIMEQYLTDIEHFDSNNPKHRERFVQSQKDLVKQFDYIVGTSTGGLIAFCLAIGHDILDLKSIYEKSDYYFKRNTLGPYLWDKYDPIHIHNQIDSIINTIVVDGKHLTAEDATLLDLHNFLNPHDKITDDMLTADQLAKTLRSHGKWLEFIDDDDTLPATQSNIRRTVPREKVLLITAYNTTTDAMTVFNTSYSKHWSYRLADVLKATMAAPTFFPPQRISNRGFGKSVEETSEEIFIDGGVFANDPELAALWAIRMQWRKQVNYYLLCIGTGCYNAKVSPTTKGGYLGWIRTDGLVVNILMDASRSMTEIIATNLAKFSNVRRMKFNYRITESMSLDDPHFVDRFNQEWESLKSGEDFQALIYFFNRYISQKQN